MPASLVLRYTERPVHKPTFAIDGKLLPVGYVFCWGCLAFLNIDDWLEPCPGAPVLPIEVAA